MKKRIVLAILLSFSSVTFAQSKPLAPGVPTVESMIKYFRDQLRTKLEELYQNYQADLQGNNTVFKSNENVKCQGHGTALPGNLSAKIEFSTSLTPTNLVEVIRYYSCNGELIFRETIYTTGANLKSSEPQTISMGHLNLSLGKDDQEKRYTLTDSDENVLIEVGQRKTASGMIAVFSILRSQGLLYTQTDLPDYTQAVYTITKDNVNYYRASGGGTERTFSNRGPYVLTVKAWKNGQKDFTVDSYGRSRFTDFIASYTSNGIQGPLESATKMLKILINELPPTSFVSAGITTSRLLDELKQALNRLNTNQSLDLVKTLVIELIQATQNGLVIDNRPQK